MAPGGPVLAHPHAPRRAPPGVEPWGAGLKPAAERASRIAIGHPEGTHQAFANLYSDVAEAVAARITGTRADPLALDFPTVEDGARGLAFITAAKASAEADGAWTDCRL